MITFVPKIKTVPKIEATKENRFDSIRRIAAEKHKKSDADTARNDRQGRVANAVEIPWRRSPGM